jgi:hypothetical protein
VIIHSAVLQAEQPQARLRPAVTSPVRRLRHNEVATDTEQWGRRFGQDCRCTERSGDNGVGLSPPPRVTAHISSVGRPHGTAVLETESEHEASKQVGTSGTTLDKPEFDIRPTPRNHKSGNASPSAQVDDEAGGNLTGESRANNKGPLGSFSQRALPIAFF